MMVNGDGDVFQPEVKRVKLFTDFCGKLEDLSIGNMEEVLVDGFLFQSFIEASDFPPMQLMCKFEVLSLDLKLDVSATTFFLPGERDR